MSDLTTALPGLLSVRPRSCLQKGGASDKQGRQSRFCALSRAICHPPFVALGDTPKRSAMKLSTPPRRRPESEGCGGLSRDPGLKPGCSSQTPNTAMSPGFSGNCRRTWAVVPNRRHIVLLSATPGRRHRPTTISRRQPAAKHGPCRPVRADKRSPACVRDVELLVPVPFTLRYGYANMSGKMAGHFAREANYTRSPLSCGPNSPGRERLGLNHGQVP